MSTNGQKLPVEADFRISGKRTEARLLVKVANCDLKTAASSASDGQMSAFATLSGCTVHQSPSHKGQKRPPRSVPSP